MSIQERLRELSVLHAVGCTTTQLAGASAVSQGALGAIGVALGLPLGLGVYLLFKVMAGGGFTGSPPPLSIALIALAAITSPPPAPSPPAGPTRPGQPGPGRRIGAAAHAGPSVPSPSPPSIVSARR